MRLSSASGFTSAVYRERGSRFAVRGSRLAVRGSRLAGRGSRLATELSKVRLDRGEEGLHVDRLGDVAVAAGVEEAVLVAAHGVGGEGEDGDAGRAQVALHLPHH